MTENVLPLCFAFEIFHKEKTIDFYTSLLNMSILEGCEAVCDGPYDGKWSKTMVYKYILFNLKNFNILKILFNVKVGYINDNFKLELTCGSIITENFGLPFTHLKIASSEVIMNINSHKYPYEINSEHNYEISDPNGYKFVVAPNTPENSTNSITEAYLFLETIGVFFRVNLPWQNILKRKVEKNTNHELDKLSLRLKLPIRLAGKDMHDRISDSHSLVSNCLISGLMEMVNPNLEDVTKLDEICVVVISIDDGHGIEFFDAKAFKNFSDEFVKHLKNRTLKYDRNNEKKTNSCCLS